MAISGVVSLLLNSGCSVLGISSVEEASYQVLENEDKFVLREYAPLVIADSSDGEEIKMTAPVLGESDGSKKKVAVLRFSGLVSEEDVESKSEPLSRWMTANNLMTASEPRWAGYNLPWSIPFLRRNEVMIDVAE